MPSRRGALRRAAVVTAVLGALAPGVASLPAVAATTPRVTYSATDVTVGTKVTATVVRGSKPAGTRLVLQRWFPDRWRAADRTASATGVGPTFTVPTDQYGTFTYRVAAKAGGAVVARSATTTVRVSPPYDPIGRARDHRFSTDPRTRWDSCSAIRWTFNRRHAPDHALRQLRGGFRRLHRATGLDFDYVGRTTQRPNPFGSRLEGAEVIVGWRTSADYGRLTPSTVGLGGNTYYPGYRQANGVRVNRAVAGGVVFNADFVGRLRSGYGRGRTWGEVIIHELGHVVGLAHVQSDKQIMFESITDRRARYGAGDLVGLRVLGDTRGCLIRAADRTARPPLGRWRSS